MKKLSWALMGCAVCLLFVAGCGSDSGTSPIPTSDVKLRLAFDLATGIDHQEVARSSQPWDRSGIDSLTLMGGALVARSFYFDSSDDLAGDDNITAADETRDLNNAAIKFQGPYVVDIDGDAALLDEHELPVGEYNHVSFVLRQGRDTDDLNGHSELLGYSAVVTGIAWYGLEPRPFRFQTDLEAELKVPGNFKVDDGIGDFALVFDVGSWFRYGNNWLDPNNPADYAQIVKNIKNSIRGGFDGDADGHLDH